MNRPHTTPSLKTIIRRVVQWSMPLSGTLLLLLFVLFKQESARALESFQNSTRDIVNLHANIIDQQLTTAESTLRYLSEQPALLRFLQDGSTSAALAGEYLRLCREYRRFNQVRVLNTQGRELLRINASQEGPQRVPEEELQNKSGRYYFREASSLSRGEVFISPFDLNVEHGTVELPWRPVIRIATPIFNPLDQVLGLLLINYGGNQLLSDLAETSVHAPGMTLLLDGAGNYLRGPGNEDAWGFMFDEERNLQNDFPEAARVLANAPSGQVLLEEGLFTFHRMRRVDLPSSEDSRAGLTVVSMVPKEVLSQHSRQLLWQLGGGVLLVNIVLLLLVFWLAILFERRRMDAEQLAASEDRLRLLSSKLLSAQEEERRRISRDLHDEFGQHLTTILVQLQRAARTSDNTKKNDLIQWGVKSAESLLETTHDWVTQLRPTLLDDLGLEQAVESFVHDYEQRTGITPTLEISIQNTDLPPVVSENVFRILQEALQNVAVHANCKTVLIQLMAAPGGLFLLVRDPGSGFDLEVVDQERLGLLGMQERLELLGGYFSLKTAPNQGTEIEAWVPLS